MIEKRLSVIKYFIGIDVSKATFNYCLRHGGSHALNGKVANNAESIKEFVLKLKDIPSFKLAHAVFGMENTGVYGFILIITLIKMRAKVVVEPALRIKNSLGIIRGKNDKLDAARITRYLIKNLQELTLFVPRRTIIDQLSSLSVLRERMLKVYKILSIPLNEEEPFIDRRISKANALLSESSISMISQSIKDIDLKIISIWTSDEACKRLMQIMLSVVGIGDVTALYILIRTNEFRFIKTARAFASYCGVAPFEHNSGTSVYKRTRVSNFANKRGKSLLHKGVMTCLAHDPEIKAYYKRRTQIDKKNKMLVMNAIKFKLICRVFACIGQDRLYDKKRNPVT